MTVQPLPTVSPNRCSAGFISHHPIVLIVSTAHHGGWPVLRQPQQHRKCSSLLHTILEFEFGVHPVIVYSAADRDVGLRESDAAGDPVKFNGNDHVDLIAAERSL